MLFHNQKLLLILAKVEGQKNKVIDKNKLNVMVNIFVCLSFFYFMSIHAGQFPQNLLVSNAQAFHQYFSSNKTLQMFLSNILLLLHLLFFGSLIFVIFQSQKLLLQRESKRKQQIIKLSALIDTFISTIGIIITALLISVNKLNPLSLDHTEIMNLIVIVLSIFNSYVMPSALFSSHIFFILTFYGISSLLGNIVLLVTTFYSIFKQKNITLTLKIIIVMAVQFMTVQLLECYMTTYQITFPLFVLIVIDFISPQQEISWQRVHQNDFLISIAEKLYNQASLSIFQIVKISLIFEQNQSLQTEVKQKKLQLDITEQHFASFQSFIQILLEKIKIDMTLFSSNNQFKLQQIQCHLLSNKISMKILKSFLQIRDIIIKKSHQAQIKRLQLIINIIEEIFVKNSKEINCLVIMAVEREVQKFYKYLGQSVEELLYFWKMVAKNEGDQFELENVLQKVVESQKKSIQVIQNLKEQKNLSTEMRMMNYFHKIINANPDPFIVDYIPQKQLKIQNTTFLLVSNYIIQQISVKLSKQLSFQKQKMIGNEMNLLFRNPISSFLLQQMDNLALDCSQDNSIFIPFFIYHSHFRFHVYRCSFQFIPDLSKGIKYLINVAEQQQSHYSYILYNLQNDMILGTSDNIFAHHRIQQNVDLTKMNGQELFNIDIPNHLFKNYNGQYNQINCHITFINLLKKSNYKHFRKNYQSQITIKVKQEYHLNNSKYLLLQIQQQNHQLKKSQAKITQLRFIQQRFDQALNINSRQQNPYFCKINNPLKALVDQKLSKVNQSFRISYYRIIVWLNNFGISLFVCFMILIFLELKSTANTLSQQFDQINKANDLRYDFYDIFQQFYQLHQVQKNPQFYMTNLNIQNITIETQSLRQNISLLIQACLTSLYANNIQIQQRNKEIIFDNYASTINIKPITIINFIAEIKQSLAQQDIYFIVQNYKEIQSIINSYVIPTSQSFTEFSTMIKYIMVSFFVLWGFIIVGCQYIFIKIQNFKRKVFQIYALVTLQQRNEYITNLQQLLSCLLKTSYSLKYATEKSIPSNSIMKQAKSLKNKEVREDIKQNKMAYSLIKTSIICIVPLILSLFLIIFYSYITDHRISINSVIEHNQRINNLLIMVKYEQMLYFQSSTVQQFKLIREQQEQALNIQNLISINNQLPYYFDQYRKIEKGILYGDLCSTITNKQQYFFKNVNCSRVLEGTLENSLSSAYSLLIHKLYRYKINFQKIQYPNSYPFIIDVFYTGFYIEGKIEDFQIQFRQKSQSFFSYIEKNISNFMISGFIILLVGLFTLIFVFRRIQSICALAFKIISVLPRKSITKLSTSKQLRNMGILDEIGLIVI